MTDRRDRRLRHLPRAQLDLAGQRPLRRRDQPVHLTQANHPRAAVARPDITRRRTGSSERRLALAAIVVIAPHRHCERCRHRRLTDRQTVQRHAFPTVLRPLVRRSSHRHPNRRKTEPLRPSCPAHHGENDLRLYSLGGDELAATPSYAS